MFCKYCGQLISDYDKFCSFCGKPQDEDTNGDGGTATLSSPNNSVDIIEAVVEKKSKAKPEAECCVCKKIITDSKEVNGSCFCKNCHNAYLKLATDKSSEAVEYFSNYNSTAMPAFVKNKIIEAAIDNSNYESSIKTDFTDPKIYVKTDFSSGKPKDYSFIKHFFSRRLPGYVIIAILSVVIALTIDSSASTFLSTSLAFVALFSFSAAFVGSFVYGIMFIVNKLME